MTAPRPRGMPPRLDALTCDGCVWRGDAGCRLAAADGAPPVPVDADTPACAHRAETLDCTACGACCREAYDSVPVTPADRVLQAHPELVRRDGDWVDLHRVPSPTGRGTRCIALMGDGPYLCRIYADRPSTCLHVEIGEDGCLFARRRVGLSPQAPA